ncbi:hypothetical protein DM01DRAFT_1375471 [Hesseltinella vesiculosa]|uniref:Uncharacterized protein n=1 Tax=Hesseltinella vesiculosa TaxID=101127 RepID=A0A1X2GD73_9FUNG|nr:hypothetical protein DM01DRAFT_1375471 [Hesseltinella vesiculosa]
MDKQAARAAFQASLPKYGAPRPCTTCLNEAFKLEKQGDLDAAEIRRAAAKTHSKSPSSKCPSYKPRKRVLTKRKLGGTTRQYTMKHGLDTLIRRPTDDVDPTSAPPSALVNAVATLARHNRDITIMSHLFIRHYVTTILNRPSLVIPPAMFTQIFFTSVFQLLMGNQITNKKVMSEEFRKDIEASGKLVGHEARPKRELTKLKLGVTTWQYALKHGH